MVWVGSLVGGGVGVVAMAIAVAVGIVFCGEVARAHDRYRGHPFGILGEAADLAFEEIEDAHDDGEDGDASERPENGREDVDAPGGRGGGGAVAIIGKGGGGGR